MKENTRTQRNHFIVKLKKTLHLTTAMAFFLQQFVPYSSAFAMDGEENLSDVSRTSQNLTSRTPAAQLARSSGGTSSSAGSSGGSPFDPSTGFTEHPVFVGKFHGKAYEVWKQLSKRETELLRPLTAKDVPIISASEKIDFILGRGNFAPTYAGRNLETRAIFAIKEVLGEQAVEESLQEGRIVHSLGDYLHIMTLVDYMHYKPYEAEEPRLFQVMPLAYIDGNGFKGMLTLSNNAQREKIVADSFYQMMMGLEYIHGKGVVHLDIKAGNTLYMKDGTLRIADFGRAKNLGANDQITDPYSGLGDKKTYSPEIVALFRKYMGGTFNLVDSISGKGADVWAVGLYVWELLEDNTDNLFSTQSFQGSLKSWAAFYTDERFEELVENISTLKGKFSPSLLNLLRQVLTVDPETRIKTPQVIKRLAPSEMKPDDRRAAFEELIRVHKNPGSAASSQASTAQLSSSQVPTPVSPPAASPRYIPKSSNQPLPSAYVPDNYPRDLNPDNDDADQLNSALKISRPASVSVYPPADPTRYIPKTNNQPLPTAYVPGSLYPGSPVQLAELNQSPSDDSLIKARKAEKLEKAKEDLQRREQLLAQREADLQKQLAAEEEKQRKKAEKEELQRREQLLAQREVDLKRQMAAEEAQRKRAIPQIAVGHEDVYERFLNGKLIYKPDPSSEKGMVVLSIADLLNPLEGEFDLSKCGYAAYYLSINTGYRKGKRPENADKVEIWFAPHFLIEKNIAGSASHFKDIIGSWNPRTAPVGIFWTWGNCVKQGRYDYLTTQSFDELSDGKNLLQKLTDHCHTTYNLTHHSNLLKSQSKFSRIYGALDFIFELK